MSLRELATELAKKDRTVTDHVTETLRRLDGLADGPWANLVAARRDDQALADAALLDAELAADRWRSPLHGVAVAVKDNIDVAGMPTRCGSAVRADAAPAERDAAIVAALREAGAIVVAKAHLHEFAYGDTGSENAAGPAAHPQDPRRITGGSSSGSAALVARGVVPLAVGTDTGCSVRLPAALCGVTGFLPGAGALRTDGVFPLAPSLDRVGLITADSVDAGLAFGAIPGVARTPWPVAGLRVGRLRDEIFDAADPEVTAAVDRAAERLRAAGAEVVDVHLPRAAELAALYPRISGPEAAAVHAELVAARGADYTPGVRGRIQAHLGDGAVDYIAALRTRAELRTETDRMLRHAQGITALLAPTAGVRAPLIGQEEIAGNSVRAELLRMCAPLSVLATAAISVPAPDVDGLPIGIQIAGLGAAPGAERIPGTHPAETITLAAALAAGS